MPTDFSFVSDEGWEALKPKFERAEKKLDDKVRRKELTEDQARRMKDLMWKKYEHWAQGKGMKEKENQTVFQDKKPTRASAMSREARIGRTQLIDILNAITDGTLQNPAIFGQTLELNKITPDEFFNLMAQDVARYPQLYPKQYIGYISELFTDWGYENEVKKVVDQARGAVGPKPPESYSRPQTPPPGAPGADAPQPSAKPAPAAPAPKAKPEPAVPGESVEDLAPKPDQFKVEPQPWPEKITPPQPSAPGRDTFRWYLQFVLPGEQAPRAAVVDGINRQDMLDYIHQAEKSGQMKFRIARPITKVNDPAKAQAPAAPEPAAAPAAKTPEKKPEQVVGEIDTPDPNDPVTYRWYLKWENSNGNSATTSPDFTGAQMAQMMKRIEQMGLKIVELKKMTIAPTAAFTIDDSDIRLAGEGDPVEKFRNGTPIIFTEDVNLEFDALSARGQIKKNMTGKIKKVEDNDYLIDIAGQLYRVPRLVAEHVMDVFAANVVPHPEEQGQQPGQKPAAQPSIQPEKAQAPAAKVPTPAQGQNQGQLPPGGAPRMPAGMAGVADHIVVADEEVDGRLVVADLEIEAMPSQEGNRAIAEAFANGASHGKANSMFIDGDTIYSYGRHFPIATWGEWQGKFVAFFTTKSHSVTTSTHKNLVHAALVAAGYDVVPSSVVAGDKVGPPNAKDVEDAAADEQKLVKREERRRQKPPKKTEINEDTLRQHQDLEKSDGVFRNLSPEDAARPPKSESVEQVPTLTPEQWMSRIDDIEGQLLREKDPARQEKLRQRLERMKQASWNQTMTRMAMTENPIGGEKADFADLQQVIRDKDKSTTREDEKKLKEHALPHEKKAAVQSQGFADLLMMIEKGGPNIPSEIGKRLYRADGAVSRVSA